MEESVTVTESDEITGQWSISKVIT